jgi:hypothetical protein
MEQEANQQTQQFRGPSPTPQLHPTPVPAAPVAPKQAAAPLTGRQVLNGKVITNVKASARASVTVIEFVGTDPGNSIFLKVRNGEVEIGGTVDWGTGTQIL